MSDWIDVKQELPQPIYNSRYDDFDPRTVLIANTYRAEEPVTFGHLTVSGKEWRFHGGNWDATPYVTHWMPLPAPPTT